MSHYRFWALGIASIILLSTVSNTHADSSDGTVVRAGRVKIIRNSDGSTQVETGRLKVDSETPSLRHRSRYGYNKYDRTIKPSSYSITTIITNSSSSSSSQQSNVPRTTRSFGKRNSQVNRVEGHNQTVTQSSTND